MIFLDVLYDINLIFSIVWLEFHNFYDMCSKMLTLYQYDVKFLLKIRICYYNFDLM